MTTFPYVWRWDECSGCILKRRKPRECPPGCPTYRPGLKGRKGTRCRVLARGAMNAASVEFADGTRMMVSRNGLRRKGSGCL